MESVVTTCGLTYRYGETAVVSGVDLAVPRGSVYGFVGPNGAGKTTTIKLLLGLLTPSGGSVELLGEPVNGRRSAALARVGALVESPALYPHLTAEENLRLDQLARGVPRANVERALAAVGLAGEGKKLVRRFSLGMKQRLGLALALLHAPSLLVLDEPSNGLDPAGVRELRETIRRLAAEEGITVLVSSHILAELESVATWIGVLARGRLRFQGPLEELKGTQPGVLGVRVDDPARAQALLRRVDLSATLRPDGLLAVGVAGREGIARVNTLLVGEGLAVSHLALEEASLERAFLALVAGVPEGAAA
ncbi:MAG TPA: ABC transporter ATP-binding protein [Thermoanaerobaculia bacterium]|nr:ABC transporter ATP-binding protein [Thermoanaerobaculia bacterium]